MGDTCRIYLYSVIIEVFYDVLKKINYIKKFGVFSDFHWSKSPNLIPFNKFNLIYAWNYSGKTTLSRIFRTFELNNHHPDFVDAHYEFELHDGRCITNTSFYSLSSFRVFNSDFINQHLKWHDGSDKIDPIFVLGQENIQLQNELAALKDKVKSVSTELVKVDTELKSKREGLEKAISKRASGMKKEFEMPDYNRPKLEKSIEKVLERTTETYRLSDKDYQAALRISISKNKKDKISNCIFPLINEAELATSVLDICDRRILTSAIERLQQNPQLNEWVRIGKELHQNTDTCQFCNNPIPSDLMSNLEKHFSKDFDQLISEISALHQRIIMIVQNVDQFLASIPDKARFYDEYAILIDEYKLDLDKATYELKEFLRYLTTLLEQKRANPFAIVPSSEQEAAVATSTVEQTHSEECARLIGLINKTIVDHNTRTDEFDHLQQQAKEKVILHHTSQFIEEVDYQQVKDELAQLQQRSVFLSQESKSISLQIQTLESRLLDASMGADKINQYLEMFFRHNRLQIEVKTDGGFVLKRNHRTAINLSEGEKSAISFVYFITQLENRNTNLENTIVFIDDPISSLDQNHIHSVFALIKTKLFIEKTCLQLFISTHNIEFLGLMKDLADEMKNHLWNRRDSCSYYFIERRNSEEETYSSIIPMPPELKAYKSEYVYLFAVLKRFQVSQSVDFNLRYSVPNTARRFLESYLNFRVPSSKNLLKKMELIFPIEHERFRVYKFVNEFSHNSLSTRSFYLPDIAECNEITNLILSAIEKSDKDHFDALCEVIHQ